MTRELYHATSVAQVLEPKVNSASASGSYFDLQGYESAMVVYDVGDWVDGSHALVLRESDDHATWSDVAAGDLIGSLPTVSGASQEKQTYAVAYVGDKRYLQAKVTITGSPNTGCLIGAVVVRGHRRSQ